MLALYLPNKNGNPFLSIKRKLGDRKYLEWQANFFLSFTKRSVHEWNLPRLLLEES